MPTMNRIMAGRLAVYAGSKLGHQGTWRGISLRKPDQATEEEDNEPMHGLSWRPMSGLMLLCRLHAGRGECVDNPGVALYLVDVKPGAFLRAMPLHDDAADRFLIGGYFYF